MAKIPKKIETWQMVEPGKLARASIDIPELKEGEVLVEIAGCGVCHTDVGFFYDGVPTVNKPPLTLGHEISGTVIAGDSALVGKDVVIPAVMPCNNCPICAEGRGNRCLAQKMPGNSTGIFGGFASHIVVPSHDLCQIPEDKQGIPLSHFAVVADAVTSPYQAAMKAGVKPGDLTIVIGVTGGLGIYATQICSALGAKEVIGIARNPEKLKRALDFGATHTIQSGGDVRAIRDEFRNYCKEKGLPNYGWKIFEWTGVAAGQEIALELLSFVGKLIIGGFGMQKTEYQLSRLMAFDADIMGSWGCLPQYYPQVLNMVLEGKIQIEPFIETRPMSTIQEAFEEAHKGGLTQRIVLIPDF